ncbi:CBS domain protein [Minicystis rosea]|nr:CBS domain protein [Minicystis rosea]
MSTSHTVGMHMTKSPVVVERNTTMAVALRIMDEQGFRHLPVVAEGKLVGVVSERELKIVDNMAGFAGRLCVVGDFVLGAPYRVSPDALLVEVARSMAENKYGSAVVCDGDTVIGMFTTTDALRALAAVLETGA